LNIPEPKSAYFMSATLHHRTPSRTYRHFSLPAVDTVELKKLEFFYIGKRTEVIDMLIQTFDSGYAAENADQARTMLKRVMSGTNAAPDVIIADAALGATALSLFTQYVSTQKNLCNIPFIIESSYVQPADLKRFINERFADDIVSIQELGADKLIRKVKFWTKVKERISKEQQPFSDDAVQHTPNDLMKRVFDIILSALLMILLSPVFLLVAIALKIESKGPIIYTSKRAGRGYNIFKFYKFRTMVAGSNDMITDLSHLNLYNPLKENGPVFIKIDNDPRITRLGAFLRKCSLDELPQLWNVFRGDMSLVGNRPLPLYEAATLTTDEWAKRFMAPAGITGLWQINKKRKYKMTAEERISLDINYADKSNFLFDLWIMANTPSAVIQRTNA